MNSSLDGYNEPEKVIVNNHDYFRWSCLNYSNILHILHNFGIIIFFIFFTRNEVIHWIDFGKLNKKAEKSFQDLQKSDKRKEKYVCSDSHPTI